RLDPTDITGMIRLAHALSLSGQESFKMNSTIQSVLKIDSSILKKKMTESDYVMLFFVIGKNPQFHWSKQTFSKLEEFNEFLIV
ncbi:hypothetical protein, partial [Vibrio cholerae]|uniref:hypothetical protein n=1 Tax=Vibrio cholerae TaxID=666 RepID=UPI001F1E17BC